MFFKTGDKVWATVPHLGREFPDVVVARSGSCVVGPCDDHPETRVYWLENLTVLCGVLLRPRDEDEDTSNPQEIEDVLEIY